MSRAALLVHDVLHVGAIVLGVLGVVACGRAFRDAPPDSGRWVWRVIALLCAVLGMLGFAGLTRAHEAPSGWKYDNYCCGGNDCQMITLDHVEVTPEGYVVTLAPGEHITAKKPHRKLFRYDEVRQSGDEHFHACILPNSQEFRCLYVPRFGA